ncbi:MAG: helix-turn-helix domain-containing GNAT family N-acetyltransferase [Pricia sp.]
MDFNEIGQMALGSRLRRLSDSLTKDARKIFNLYHVELKPKWFPVYYFLSDEIEGKSIMAIANNVGQSHPSVIKIVKEMVKSGLLQERKDKNDGRKNLVSLTDKGNNISEKIKTQYEDVDRAVGKTLESTSHNLWLALQEFEYVLQKKSMFERILEQKKIRESASIEIVDYRPEHHRAFRELNENWIIQYFKLEDADRIALNNPKEYILDNGGAILVAIEHEKILGVCALLKMEDDTYDYELAKMAVSPDAQGKGIGSKLGNAIIERARKLGASKLYLESNTILNPAISLYRKLGFQKISHRSTPYQRCNIQMELILK